MKWQIMFNLMVSSREWIDFVSFCSDFPEGKRLFSCRLFSVDLIEEFKSMYARLEQFRDLVKLKKQIIMGI